MVKLISALSRYRASTILLAGDLMLDTYTIGKARRISPEAPVAVISAAEDQERAGGAGNVALNLMALGCSVKLLGRIGQDGPGFRLKEILSGCGVQCEGLFQELGWQTPLKQRVIADNQQVVRIDREKVSPISEKLEEDIIQAIPALFEGVSALAISDYGKGFLTPLLLATLISEANKRSIPVIVDPKGVDFTRYKGAFCIKPNLHESYAAASLSSDHSLEQVAKKLLKETECRHLLITRSEAGITHFDADMHRTDFPVVAKDIKDVTGAGDTVLAALTASLAWGLSIEEAASLSNVAAGIAISQFGCAKVSLSDLARKLLESDVSSKIYDAGHLFALKKALEFRPFDLLWIPNPSEVSLSFVKQIRTLAKGQDLLVCVDEQRASEEFLEFLISLNEVDFILLVEKDRNLDPDLLNPTRLWVYESGAFVQGQLELLFS